MKLQTLTSYALIALPMVFANPIPSTLFTRAVAPTANEMTASISTFQTLVLEALTPASNNTESIAKRDNTAALDNINSIFDSIYGIADGSVPLPSLERRDTELKDIVAVLNRLLRRILPKASITLTKRSEVEIDIADFVAELYAWADGTLPIPVAPSENVELTIDDGLELASVLKDLVILWRTALNSDGSIVTSDTAMMLEKRITRAQVKAGLHALAAAIDFVADLL